MNRKLPNARSVNIVVQNSGQEVLIYDFNTNKAFCLNDTAAKVFIACDGKTTFSELKTKFQFSDDIIFLALAELLKRNLLTENANYQLAFAATNRREIIKKIGLASMIALPIVSSIIAPTATQAASGGAAIGAACFANSECASNNCVGGRNSPTCCSPTTAFSNIAPNDTFCSEPNQVCSSNAYLCCSGSVRDGAFNCGDPQRLPCICN
jgi:hypothetical protein